MPSLVTTNTPYQAATKVLERDYLNELDLIPQQYEPIINTYTPKDRRRFIQFLPYTGLGDMTEKDEGTAPTFDSPNEMIPFYTTFSTYALGGMVTYEASIEDPLDLLAKIPRMLAQSERDTVDKLAVGMLNLGFSSAKPLPDGQPLFSTAHPLDPVVTPTGVVSRSGLTYSNSLGNAQLTPEMLRQADLLAELMIDDRGKKDKRTLVHLVYHPNLSQIAEEIVGTPTAPYENTRKINVQNKRWNLYPWRDLTNQYAWFCLADKGEPGSDCHALTVWFRWRNKLYRFVDPMTQNQVIVASFRMAQGAWDWRGAVGSQGGGPVSA